MTRKKANKPDATPVHTAKTLDAKTDAKPDGVNSHTAEAVPPLRQDGLQIDTFGLPVNTIARQSILRQLDSKDPVQDKSAAKAWDETKTGMARTLTEKSYG